MEFLKSGGQTAVRLRYLIVLVMLGGCTSASPTEQDRAQKSSESQPTGTVNLSIELPAPAQTIDMEVKVDKDTTVFDALRQAEQSDKRIQLDVSGSGETAFVRSLGGVTNRGAAGKNWIYYVNGELANRGAGVFQIAPGDRVVWRFGQYP